MTSHAGEEGSDREEAASQEPLVNEGKTVANHEEVAASHKNISASDDIAPDKESQEVKPQYSANNLHSHS